MLSNGALSQRARAAIIGVVGAVAAFFVFGGAGSVGGASSEPFDAVPRDAFLVATLNLAELRRSPLYDVLLGKESPAHAARASTGVLNARALGIEKLADACGFDPLSRVDRLAVAVPENGEKGELGVAARVNVTSDELSKCTGALADQRGGKVETKDVGGFVVVEDLASGGHVEGAPRSRLAYGRGGLLVAGRGAWFDAMLAAADGKKPSARDAVAHVAMRASLTGREGWRMPTVLISALLPRALRDRLKNEMGAELSGAKPDDSSQSVMAGVLDVAGVGFALRAGTPGQNVDAAVELVCDNDDACRAVEKLILKKRLDWSKELTLRMVGFGSLLDSIDVRREGLRIRVTAGTSADALASTIDRVLRLRGSSGPNRPDAAPGRPAPVLAPAARSSDETIPAPRPSALPPNTGLNTGLNTGP